MRAIPFKIAKEDQHSIKVQIDQGPHFYDKLHYHPEVQVTAIVQGTGIVYGGNNMQTFGPGDIVVFGGRIPHLLKNGPAYYTADSPGVLSYSLFFDKETFGGGLFQITEMARISHLLDNATRGIVLHDTAIKQKVSAAVNLSNEDLVISLLDILRSIEQSAYTYINSDLYNLSLDDRVGSRLNTILEYTFAHIDQKIHVEAVAQKANLSKSQFSRYFKTHTGKSYIQFLNEVRVENACTLMLEQKDNIASICYEVGFNNVSNFNRIFKKVKGLSPKAYRQKHSR